MLAAVMSDDSWFMLCCRDFTQGENHNNIITVRWLRAAADEGRCRVVVAAATVCGAGDDDWRWRPCFGYRCEMCEEKRVRGMRLDTALSQLRGEADEEMWACVCVG